MNLNELWSGTDYAYYEYKRRGELYRANAKRVKIIRAFKEKQYGNERLSGFAEVLFCDAETGEPQVKYGDNHHIGTVRARDIAMRWEEYAELDAHRKAERERAEAERRERREAAERERKRIEELENLQRERVKAVLTNKYGMPERFITSIDNYMIHISRAEVEKEVEVV